jgi:hypothetical protein
VCRAVVGVVRTDGKGRDVSLTGLRWIVGIFAVAIGTTMVLVPWQYVTSASSPLAPLLPLGGALLLLGGAGLIGIVVFALPRPIAIAAHALAGAMLAIVGIGAWLTETGPVLGPVGCATLGIGTALAPFLPGAGAPTFGRQISLVTILIAFAAVVSGGLLIGASDLFVAPRFAAARPNLMWYGLALLAGGLVVGAAQLRHDWRPWLRKLAHVALAAAMLSWLLAVGLPA